MAHVKNILILLLLAPFCGAANLALADHIHSIRLKNGAEETFRFHEEMNENKERELIVSLEEFHLMAPTTEHAILYARDIDGNAKYSAWFYRDENGSFVAERHIPAAEDGLDIASELIEDKLSSHERWFTTIVFSAVMSKVTITGYYQAKSSNNLEHLLLDEADLNLRMEEIPTAERRNNSEYEYLSDLQEKTLQEIQNTMRSENFAHTSAHVMEDLVLLFVGGRIVQGAGYVLAGIAGKFAESTAGQLIVRALAASTRVIDERVAMLAERPIVRMIGRPFGLLGEQLSLRARWLAMPVPEQLRMSLSALMSRSRLGQLLMEKGQSALSASLKGLKQQAFYMTLTQGLQVKAEVTDRPKDLYDPNPIIMTKKLASDKDFKQDFIYMTDETVGTTIITNALLKRGFLTSMFACAIFSLTDSAFVDWFVKHETDVKRAAFDTGWEVGIGNTQTFVDLKAMDIFNAISGRIQNPKLKLLGYALVWGERVGDQYGGYMAYGKASEDYDNYHKKEEAAAKNATARVIPIYGEVAGS